MIGDFGVPIAILIMVLVDYSIEDTYTQVRWRSRSPAEPPSPQLPGTWADTASPVQLRALPPGFSGPRPRPLSRRS